MELIIEGCGTGVAKHQGRIRVRCERQTITEAPLVHMGSCDHY
jgi:hypothetical protein